MDQETFGRYQLLGLIGQGGMGKVFRAFDPVLQREVAIKVLPVDRAGEQNFRQRFRREALTTARLNDPHVVPVFDSGELDGQLYLVMAVIDGVDLQTLLQREGPMNPQQAVRVIEQVAAALDAAHAAGLVHRDIKPSNVLMTGRGHVYLIDFGIAHDSAATQITHTGIIGTVAYMAPERLSAGQVDVRGDVYSLACVFYECLTGSPPYSGDTLEQQITAHLTQPAPRPSVQRPGVAAAFDDVVARGMAKDPDRRHQTANEFAAAARLALDQGGPAVGITRAAPTVPHAGTQWPPPPRESEWRTQAASGASPEDGRAVAPRRTAVSKFWMLTVGAVAIVAVIVASVVYFWPTRTSTTGSAPATTPQPTSSAVLTTTPAGPPTMAATIRVGNGAFGVAVDPSANIAYVANSGADSVSVIDTASRAVTATIAVGRRPVGVAVDTSTGTVYVANYDDSSVSVIDAARRTVIATVSVGGHPGGVVVDPDTRTAYVTNGETASVAVIDTTTHTVTATVPAGTGPSRLAIDPTAHRLFVTNGDTTVTVIDTTNRNVVGTVALPGQPAGVAVDPESHTAYVTNIDKASVSVIDTASLIVTATFPVGQRPGGVAVDPTAQTAYVANYDGSSVSVIDATTRAVIGIVAVGNNPLGVAVDPSTHAAYVTSDLDHGSVSIIER